MSSTPNAPPAELRAILDALPGLVAFVAADERYGFVNVAYEQWFGLSREAVVGKTVREVIGDAAYARLQPFVQRGIDGETFSFEQYEVPYRSGGTRDIRVDFVPRRHADGSSNGYVSLLQDITLERRANRELRLSADRLELALRAGRMGTWELDLATNELRSSATCRANYGRDATSPFTYDDLAESVLPEDRPAWRAAVAAAIESQSDLDVEYRVRWPDGTLHWAHVRASCMVEDGRVATMSGVSINVDDRKEIEAEMMAADRRKDEFLTTASHELRTPLNAILGWATLLRDGHVEGNDVGKAGATIERNARSQVKLIEDILDGSRIISGKLRLEVRPLDLRELVRAAVDVIRPAALAKNIALVVTVDPDAARVVGDPDRLQQIVWNLGNNAIKFTPRGGHVEVTLARVGTSIELRVTDSGRGIDAEFLPHVFERFRQADGSTTRRHGGLGLGLALVRHLVDAHGGAVRAESDGDGRGATFIVTLPVQAVFAEPLLPSPSEPPSSNLGPVSQPRLTGMTVLVVDDEADARELVAAVLRLGGATVETAANADEALAVLARAPVSIVVSDVGMPNADGYGLVRALRADTDGVNAATPALALTAYAREEDRRMAHAAGFQAHVAKPVAPDELLRAVSRLVRGTTSAVALEPEPSSAS